jgi:uncharacterized membrane protein YtjA (UPF0391 family)
MQRLQACLPVAPAARIAATPPELQPAESQRERSFAGAGTAPALHGTAGWSSRPAPRSPYQENLMLHYAVVFFIIALVAALFGFGGIAAGAAEIAKILFFIFIIIAAITFVLSLLRRG